MPGLDLQELLIAFLDLGFALAHFFLANLLLLPFRMDMFILPWLSEKGRF